MGVEQKHPDWEDRRDEWKLMRDATRGDKAIKEATVTYLPMPSGFKAQEDGGNALYSAYQTRAQFPQILDPTLGGMVGVVHRNEPTIKMPKAMEPLFEHATKDGMTLEALHKRITRELLTTGRFGLLADAPSDGVGLPYLAGYTTESIINWSEDGDFFVLDESGRVRNGFSWETEPKYRVLEIKNGAYSVTVHKSGAETVVTPTQRGDKKFESIPFVVIGTTDCTPTPEDPPMIGVARSAVALYQLSADYRWQLFMTGQETLVIINGEAPTAVGAGVCITLKAGTDTGQPDAKYVGPTGTGINAHRTAIQDERQAASAAGARLLADEAKTAESGDALRLRFTSQTATLTTISQASCQGLERGLRHIAEMMGLNPNDVTVTPPKRLIDSTLTPQEAQALVKIWQDGAISYTTLYDNLQRGEIASEERDAEEERELIDKEDIDSAPPDPKLSGLLPPPVVKEGLAA